MNRFGSIAVAACAVLVSVTPSAAQKPQETPESHCDASYAVDIGPNVTAQPDGTWQTVSGDCTGISGCDHYFDFTCLGGEAVILSFCQMGGTADFDTGLSTWSGAGFPTQESCNDDTCSLLSEVSWTVPAGGTYRMRVGAFGGGSGTYTLAYQMPATCTIENAIPAELTEFEVE